MTVLLAPFTTEMDIGLGIERRRGQSGIVYAGTRCIHHDAVVYGVQDPLRRRYALGGVSSYNCHCGRFANRSTVQR